MKKIPIIFNWFSVYNFTMDLDETRISVSVTTVEFKQSEAGTKLIYTEQGAFLDGHDTAAEREHGTGIMLDKLGEELRGERTNTYKTEKEDFTMSLKDSTNNNSSDAISNREIVSTRIFNASREHIFKAFSDPDHLIHWWGPKGFTNTFHEFDMQPGRVWHYVMHGPNGVGYENKSVFVEVVEPERIVLRHLEPDHEFLLTVTLSERDGKTELTWQMLFDSAAECNKARKFVVEGNEQNLDRLQAQLGKMV
ncbi:ATPase [Pueribacillus theae]|uniref:ATPase n=1 Tax=Pueribacillus theae TaxID=2171751 RepID=A0A2U1JWA6_9BACI|nr:ATPase [Pueribacillus theae]